MGREINKHNKIRNKKIHNLVESLSSIINLQEQSIETPINWKIVGTSPFRRASNGTSAFKNIRKSWDFILLGMNKLKNTEKVGSMPELERR